MFATDGKVTSWPGAKMFSLCRCHAVINRSGFKGFKLRVTHVTFGDDRAVGYQQGSSRRFWKHLIYSAILSRHTRREEFQACKKGVVKIHTDIHTQYNDVKNLNSFLLVQLLDFQLLHS